MTSAWLFLSRPNSKLKGKVRGTHNLNIGTCKSLHHTSIDKLKMQILREAKAKSLLRASTPKGKRSKAEAKLLVQATT